MGFTLWGSLQIAGRGKDIYEEIEVIYKDHNRSDGMKGILTGYKGRRII